MRRYLCEFLATFALVFAGTGAIVADALSDGAVTHVGVSLTFGLVVAAMIYAVGDVSGAHLNPAVTVGFWLAGRLPGRLVLPYALSQVLGAIVASVSLRAMLGNEATLGATLPTAGAGPSFALEIVITLFLMFTILGVTTGAREKGVLAGLAVGGFVALAALFAGPLSGASMNPARSIGPALASGQFQGLWIYLVAPTIGAGLAVVGCRFTHGSDCCGSPSA